MQTPPRQQTNTPDLLMAAESSGSNARNATHSTRSGGKYSVNVFDALSDLPVRFEALFAAAGNTSIFFTLPWFKNYVQTVLAPNERLRIYTVDSLGESLTARAVLIMHYRVTSKGPLGFSVLSSLGNYYTSLFGVIIEPGQPDVQPIFDALATAIVGDNLRWDEIDLHPLAMDAAEFNALTHAFRKAGLLLQTYFAFGNWYLEVNNQSFTDYLAGRPSRLSKTGKRARRILETGGHFRFELYKDSERAQQAFTDYNVVYNSSWKIPEPHPHFVEGLIKFCAEQGWLRLGIAYLDNEPAAAQIWIVVGGQASIYKMAYDERFAKQSVGTVLSSLLMEHVIEVDKVTVVDYLTGDDNYKRDWMSHRRERWGIRAFNPRTPCGLFAAARHMGGRVARRALDKLRNLRGTKT